MCNESFQESQRKRQIYPGLQRGGSNSSHASCNDHLACSDVAAQAGHMKMTVLSAAMQNIHALLPLTLDDAQRFCCRKGLLQSLRLLLKHEVIESPSIEAIAIEDVPRLRKYIKCPSSTRRPILLKKFTHQPALTAVLIL